MSEETDQPEAEPAPFRELRRRQLEALNAMQQQDKLLKQQELAALRMEQAAVKISEQRTEK